MSIHETIDKATTHVIEIETSYVNRLFKQYENAQENIDEKSVNFWLDEICKEKKRLDPKNKYDQEEVWIALHNKKQGI